jgi:hypothetical protein
VTSERRRAIIIMMGVGSTLSLLRGRLLTSSITASLTVSRMGAAKVRVSGDDVGMLVLMPILVALAAWGTIAAFRDGGALRQIGNGIAVAAMLAIPAALADSWAFQAWAAAGGRWLRALRNGPDGSFPVIDALRSQSLSGLSPTRWSWVWKGSRSAG